MQQKATLIKIIIRRIYYFLALFFSKIVIILPYRFAVLCGGGLGVAAFYCAREARALAVENLKNSFPGKSERDIAQLARLVFVNQGKNVFELFSFPKLGKNDVEAICKIKNRECMVNALAGGKGVLIASAHCGNWEMMGAALSLSGFPINVIARRIYIEGLNRMLVSLRNSKGVRVILRSGKESAREILRSLRHNEAIGILIDQDTTVPGVFVNFFSRNAWTPSGLAILALRTGANVVLALDVRLPDDTHEVILSGPISIKKTGNMESDIIENTQLITTLIEDHIRAYPAQWVWMHNRWKTKLP